MPYITKLVQGLNSSIKLSNNDTLLFYCIISHIIIKVGLVSHFINMTYSQLVSLLEKFLRSGINLENFNTVS